MKNPSQLPLSINNVYLRYGDKNVAADGIRDMSLNCIMGGTARVETRAGRGGGHACGRNFFMCSEVQSMCLFGSDKSKVVPDFHGEPFTLVVSESIMFYGEE